jgi:hypothetical protein
MAIEKTLLESVVSLISVCISRCLENSDQNPTYWPSTLALSGSTLVSLPRCSGKGSIVTVNRFYAILVISPH